MKGFALKFAAVIAICSIGLQLIGIHVPSAFLASLSAMQIGSEGLFGTALLLQESLTSRPPPSFIPIGYWNSLQLKAIYISRYFLKDNFLFEDWMNGIHISILRDFEARGLAMERLAPEPIANVDIASADFSQLYNDFVLADRPVVLNNVGVGAMQWTSHTLRDRYGEYEALLHCCNGTVGGQSLGRFVDRAASDCCSLSGGNEDLFDTYPDLLDELEIHKFSELLSGRINSAGEKPPSFLSADLEFSLSQESGVSFRSVNHVSLFYMVSGVSRWTFVDPSSSFLMYPYFDAAFQSAHSWLTWEALHAHNSTDIARQYFPLYRYARRVTLDLGPGDVLLIPPWMWHTVDYYGPESIGVATKWARPRTLLSPLQYSNALFSLLQFFSKEFVQRIYQNLTPVGFSSHYHLNKQSGSNLDSLFNFGKLNSLYRRGYFVRNVVNSQHWDDYLSGIVINSKKVSSSSSSDS